LSRATHISSFRRKGLNFQDEISEILFFVVVVQEYSFSQQFVHLIDEANVLFFHPYFFVIEETASHLEGYKPKNDRNEQNNVLDK